MTKLIIVGAPGPAGLPPPFISGLQHWWDFTDASQVFQDVGGITPSGDGDPILRVNNKGYDGQPLIDAASQLTYTVDLIPNVNVGTNTGLLPLVTALNNALSTDGITVVIVLRSQDGATSNPLKWESGGDVSQIQADIDGSGNWEIQFDLADERDTTKPVVADELLSVYGAIRGGSIDYKASGTPIQSGSSGYPVTDAGLTLTVGEFSGNIAEILIYDFKLSTSQQSDLDQRINSKYKGLPQVIPSAPPPPALGNLVHWVDPGDASTVWQDAAGTIPAGDGDTVLRIDNKGSDGTPLNGSFGTPIYRTGVLNGTNVIEFSSARLEAVIAAALTISTTGYTIAMVTRRQAQHFGDSILWRWTPPVGNPGPSLRGKSFLDGNFHRADLLPDEVLVPDPSTQDDWYLLYLSNDAAGSTDDAKYGSPGPEVVTPFGNAVDIPAGAEVRYGTSSTQVQHSEAWFWNRPLTAAERAQLIAFAEGKYGVMPHP